MFRVGSGGLFEFNVPLFLVSWQQKIEVGTLGRSIFFGHIVDVLEFLASSRQEEGVDGVEIGLLSQNVMNGQDFYQFGRIKEIWLERKEYKQMYVMEDGQRLHFPLCEAGAPEPKLERIVCL